MQASCSTYTYECRVCFERYNDSDHLPKSLPCGHSYCLKCMKDLFDGRNSITCPICRSVTVRTPASLPINYIVFDTLSSSSSQPRIGMCPKHSNKLIDIYCSDCRVCVCSSCFIKDHKSHTGMEIPDDALTAMKSSSTLLSKLDDVCDEISATVTLLNEVEIDLQRKETDIVASIRESFNQIRAAVDAREEALISSLPSKRLAITSHKHELESFLSHVQTTTQSFRDLLQSSDVVRFVSSRESIVASLSRLETETKSNDFRVKYNSHLRISCDNPDIIKSINQLGQFLLEPCQSEMECRSTVIDILKQSRGAENWNGTDDKGTRLTWREELPLGDWNGSASNYGRWTQVDRNGILTHLLLNHLGMRGILPVFVGNLASLILLDVGHNKLSHLPGSICNLTSLKYLFVHNNQLTHIPYSFGSLTCLWELRLNDNELTYLPDSICNLTSLTKLYVNHNKLIHLPASIGNLTTLTILNISDNQVCLIAESISNLTSLAGLWVGNNPVTSTQEDKDEVKRRFGRSGLKINV